MLFRLFKLDVGCEKGDGLHLGDSMNFKRLRGDFPMFGKKGVPKECVYLDSAATSQKPLQMIEAIADFYTHGNANIHRSIHDLGEQATTKYEEVRAKVAKFINAADTSEIVFTSGATQGINFVASSWARKNLKKGDEILITEAEHHANFLPWQHLATELGVVIKTITINKDRFLLGCNNELHESPDDESLYMMSSGIDNDFCSESDCDYFDSLITPKTKFVALTYDSNVLGNVWDQDYTFLYTLIERAHKNGAKVLVDAAQVVGHQKIDVQRLGADFMVFSAHKMFGPTGIGVLYIAQDLHDEVAPYQFGGSMVHSTHGESPRWRSAPHKFEAGTPPIAQVIGLGAAIDYITENIDYAEFKQYRAALCSQLIDGLQAIDGLEIIGNVPRIREGGKMVTFTIDGMHPHDIASCLDMYGIATRAGHHCAQPLATTLGVESSLRVSLHLYNNSRDIEIFLDALHEAIRQIRQKLQSV